jgi:hypothetical protein
VSSLEVIETDIVHNLVAETYHQLLHPTPSSYKRLPLSLPILL